MSSKGVSCSRESVLRFAWAGLLSEPKGIIVGLLGVAVFGAGIWVKIASRTDVGLTVVFLGIALVVLGLLLPLISEFELSLTSVRFKTQFGGRDEEFRPFVDAERGHLYQFALLFLCEPAMATTLVEDAFASTYLAWRRLGDEERGRHVLCRLAHLALGRTALFGLPLASDDSGADSTSDDQEEPLRTAHILRRLPADLRLILLLKHYEAIDEQDIARMLGRPIDEVNSCLQRATSMMQSGFSGLDTARRT
jgi:DNA-directed RNA polymerase specialized sigma24 family protein